MREGWQGASKKALFKKVSVASEGEGRQEDTEKEGKEGGGS